MCQYGGIVRQKSESSLKKPHLYKEITRMKNKNRAVLCLLVVTVMTFSGVGQMSSRTELAGTKSVMPASKPGPQLPIVVPHEGTGPACIPGTGCGS